MHLVLILLKKQQIKKKKKLQSLPGTSKKEKKTIKTSPINQLFAKPNSLYSFLYNTFRLPSFFCVIRPGIRSGNFSHIIKTGLENMFYH